MMKTCIAAALLLGAAASSVLAQDAPKQPKIAVIDMGKVSSESLLGKGYAAQLEQLKSEIDAEGNKKQGELSKLDAGIKALQDELDKQGSVLSPEAADKKRQDIVKKTRERQAFLEDGQQDLQRMRERAQQQAQALNNEFQVKIKPHIDAVAKEKGIDILLDSQVAISVSKDFDISKDVIVKADDAERAAKGAAAKPAPKPNTPPAPKP
jgi:Skp family chaperone for outer membrane proteins